MKKIFLENLPRWRFGKLKPNGEILWKESIGFKVKFIYEDIEGEVEIVDYTVKNQQLTIKYKNIIFCTSTSHFQQCGLGRLLGKYTSEFKVKIGQIFKDDKRDMVIIDTKYKNIIRNDGRFESRRWCKYKCNKCGYNEGWIEENNLLKGTGCSCCANKTAVLGINTIWDTDKWMVDLGVSEENAKSHTKCSHQKTKIICPYCGRKKEMMISTIYTNKSIGCSCGDGYSYGHKYIFNLLTQLNLKFIDNYTFDWCKFYNPFKERECEGEYDFVLENNKLIIEVDGGFHRKDNKMSGQTKEESQFIDNEKDRLAIKNGYKIIRVLYEDNMKYNILNSELSYLFDLDSIDWNKCEDFAIKNRVKEACELKKNNPNYTTKDIAKIMNIGVGAITRYLKKGSELGWCEYDPKKEKSKSSSRAGKKNKKPVEIFKNGISIGIFESGIELERKSELLFGVKLNFKNISAVCNNKRKSHKRFTFKYI